VKLEFQTPGCIAGVPHIRSDRWHPTQPIKRGNEEEQGKEVYCYIIQHEHSTGRVKGCTSAHLWGSYMTFRFKGRI
jgi:hypothetical protein